MHYQPLGRSGLMVSELCLGTMIFGEDSRRSTDATTATRMIHQFLDAGGVVAIDVGHEDAVLGDDQGLVALAVISLLPVVIKKIRARKEHGSGSDAATFTVTGENDAPVAKRPPGFSTRSMERRAASLSVTLRRPKAMVTQSKLSSAIMASRQAR